MNDVFLSYSRKDRKQAKKLASALESLGLKVWWDTKIIAGQAFDITIEKQLKNSKSVVVLWSENSISSEWVKNESAYAVSQGILIPAMLGQVEIPLEFQRKQTIDISNWNGDINNSAFQELCLGIETVADIEASSSLAAPVKKGSNHKTYLLLIALVISSFLFILYSNYFENYQYKKNLSIITSDFKSGNYTGKTAQLIRKNLKIAPYKIDLYRLIAWKKKSLRNSTEDEIFREFTSFAAGAIFDGFPSKNNIDLYIKNIDFYSNEKAISEFDPIPFISQLYTEAAILRGVSKENIYFVLQKIIGSFKKTPERLTSIAIVDTEFLEDKDKLKILKEKLFNVLKSNSHNIYFNESYISQQGWDHLAQLEVVLCSIDSKNKKKYIENISKYYLNVINNRTKALERNPNKIFWLSSPKKLSLYSHIIKWNTPDILKKEDNLNVFEKMCPSYGKTLQLSLKKYPNFINENYLSSWDKGTINLKNLFE